MTTDGPAALRRLATSISCGFAPHPYDIEVMAAAWQAERERNIRTDWRKCPNCSVDWPHPSETSSFVCPSCRAAADRAALERLRDTSRQFPLQDGPSVPWSCIAPHERQAQANHYQTIQRLAERGGLSCAEFWFVMNDKKWDDAQASNADKSGRALAEVIITSHDKTRRERDEARAALAQARALLVRHAVRYGALGLECEQCGMTLPGHASGCLVAEVLGGAR